MIAIIDYGAGNLRSVQKALERCGVEAQLVTRGSDLLEADKAVFPGVGAFGKASEALAAGGFFDAVKAFIASGRPFLGICLGMQMLFESSEESPGTPGLAVLPGHVRRFAETLKVPHLGWNEVRQTAESPLWRAIPDDSSFYFAHSYYVQPEDPAVVCGVCDYGGPVTAAVRRGLLFGVQFHPEKSQRLGLKLLENFARL